MAVEPDDRKDPNPQRPRFFPTTIVDVMVPVVILVCWSLQPESRLHEHGWGLIGAVVLAIGYALCCWRANGKRLGLPFSAGFADFREMQTPPDASLFPCYHPVLFWRPNRAEDHQRVQELVRNVSERREYRDRIKRLFLKGERDENEAAKLFERWGAEVSRASCRLIIPQLPRTAGAWFQPDLDSPDPDPRFIIGIEQFLLNSAMAQPGLLHEMAHGAQSIRDQLLEADSAVGKATDRGPKGIPKSQGVALEIEAHFTAWEAAVPLLPRLLLWVGIIFATRHFV